MNPRILRRLAAPALAVLLLSQTAAAQQTVRLPVGDRALTGRPTDLFSIGAAEGESWEMLAGVERVAFDRSDNLYVLDSGNHRVLVFDRGGRFIRAIGKKGDGPGEFQIPRGLAVLANGDLAVLDVGHSNVSIFAPNGTFRHTSAWAPEWGLPTMRIEPHPAGGVVAFLRPALDLNAMRSGEQPARNQFFARLALDARGGAERLFEISDPTRVQSASSGGGGGERRVQMRMMGPPEFSPIPLWGVLPGGGSALAHNTLYTVKIQDAAGRTVRFLQRPVAVRRPTERDKERARQRFREQLQSGRGMVTITRGGSGGRGGAPGLSRQQIEERVGEMQFADTVRALQGLTIAPSGKLWIERTPQNIGDPGPIDLVTPQGQYLGTLNGQQRPVAISASGRAAYIERDEELDVDRVVVRQLPAGWR
jgi:6-bladed beta-propeller